MMTLDALRGRRTEILALAARHKAGHVRVFGSLARGEADESSDIDLLVDFRPDASLFDLIHLREEARTLLGATVDIVSGNGLSPLLADRIKAEAIDL